MHDIEAIKSHFPIGSVWLSSGETTYTIVASAIASNEPALDVSLRYVTLAGQWGGMVRRFDSLADALNTLGKRIDAGAEAKPAERAEPEAPGNESEAIGKRFEANSQWVGVDGFERKISSVADLGVRGTLVSWRMRDDDIGEFGVSRYFQSLEEAERYFGKPKVIVRGGYTIRTIEPDEFANIRRKQLNEARAMRPDHITVDEWEALLCCFVEQMKSTGIDCSPIAAAGSLIANHFGDTDRELERIGAARATKKKLPVGMLPQRRSRQ